MAKANSRLDWGTIGGLLLAAGGIVGGLILEGGSLKDIGQYTALIIVLGGTLGAVMISTPMDVFAGAMGRVRRVLFEPRQNMSGVLDNILACAMKARKSGLVSLEQDADQTPDPFLRKALNLAVDGCDLQEIRKMMELEIDLAEERAEAEAKVFEVAGGYAPTIGIIGAVLGLIQVMKKLADTEQVGHGIAVAFVATVYGVAFANIFFLPIAQKIRARARTERAAKELMLEGVCGIVEGLNPKLIRSNLEAFLPVNLPPARPTVSRGREAA